MCAGLSLSVSFAVPPSISPASTQCTMSLSVLHMKMFLIQKITAPLLIEVTFKCCCKALGMRRVQWPDGMPAPSSKYISTPTLGTKCPGLSCDSAWYEPLYCGKCVSTYKRYGWLVFHSQEERRGPTHSAQGHPSTSIGEPLRLRKYQVWGYLGPEWPHLAS
jgi:hypothetical protein